MSVERSWIWSVVHFSISKMLTNPAPASEVAVYHDVLDLTNLLEIRAFLLQYATDGKWQAGGRSRP